jgi:hypothetical protein
MPLAAILCEKTHEFRHAFEVNGVVNELPILPRGHETRASELFQMKRQRGPRNFKVAPMRPTVSPSRPASTSKR